MTEMQRCRGAGAGGEREGGSKRVKRQLVNTFWYIIVFINSKELVLLIVKQLLNRVN